MASGALSALLAAVAEVDDLQRAAPRVTGVPSASRAVARVVSRATVVLLSSHFERYFYAVNEEAASFVNACSLPGDRLPEQLRLVHSKYAIEQIQSMSWERRAEQLKDFVRNDSWLWTAGGGGQISSDRILSWMKSPKPESLKRFYRYWGINNIFDAVTRKAQTRQVFELRVRELVDKRNNIAHGDFNAQATRLDVQRYVGTVTNFCGRADRALSRALGRLTGQVPPW